MFTYTYILGPPVIDEGSFVLMPSSITSGDKRVKIGTPVYVHDGYNVIIDCEVVDGSPPINITWFRNGSPYPTSGSVSTITITDANYEDVFKCRADNSIGFDIESTVIYVEYGKGVRMSCIHYIDNCLCVHTYVLCVVCVRVYMRVGVVVCVVCVCMCVCVVACEMVVNCVA